MKLNDFVNLRWTKFKEPFLKKGKRGSWDDYAVFTPAVWLDNNSRKYYMFYTGQDYNGSWSIGLAESSDLINWEKWDRPLFEGCKHSIFSIDGPALTYYNGYHLFFESKNKKVSRHKNKYLILLSRTLKNHFQRSMAVDHASERSIFHATSQSLLSWDFRSPELVIKEKDIFSPLIYKFNNNFFLLFSKSENRNTNVFLASSCDLKSWSVRPQAIFSHGEFGEWDQRHVAIVSILELDDGYVGFYEGEDRHNNYKIGIVYTKDFLKWSRFPDNPILETGNKGDFDEKMVCSPHAVEYDGKVYLFYSGHNRFMQGSCGLAIGEPKF
jgi:predicted GH43/DUF377 family glycosyl hydrolase